MGYLGEIKTHSRALFSATLGLSFGISINTYTTSLFGAHLIREFGWARSDFAIVGTLSLVLLVVFPIAGRITDLIGVRKAAAIGIFGMPLAYLAFSMMTGDIRLFYAINLATMIIGSFTTAVVFNRVVAERFVTARGLAFAIVMTGAPLFGALAAPAFGAFIESYDWRAGYLLLGGVSFFFGLIALFLLPPHIPSTSRPSTIRLDFKKVSRSAPFWFLFAGMFLINLPQALGSSQLMIMLAEKGVPLSAAWYISLYPVGVIIGRFIFGTALDRLPPHLVGAVGLAFPAIGYAVLAGSADATMALAFAVLLMGLAQGAEGDVASFLVGRHFPIAIFASTNGLISAATAFGAATGSAVLQQVLIHFDSFSPFLIFSAVVTVVGAMMIVQIGPGNPRRGHAIPEEALPI